MVMSGRSVNLATLSLGRLRLPKRVTSTSCTYSPVTDNCRKEKRKYVARSGLRTRDPWLLSQTRYRLRYEARRWSLNFSHFRVLLLRTIRLWHINISCRQLIIMGFNLFWPVYIYISTWTTSGRKHGNPIIIYELSPWLQMELFPLSLSWRLIGRI